MWNWNQKNWPNFEFSPSNFATLEQQFLIEAAKLIGASSVTTEDEQRRFTIDLMSEEALKSSRIEGEVLNRDSVSSSLLRQLGLAPRFSDHGASDKEQGIAALMVDNYNTYNQPLTHETLFKWHSCAMSGSHHIKDIGKYRTSKEPMQVVSGYEGRYKVHFEAPPANMLQDEMNTFIHWYNDTSPHGSKPLPSLTRAGLAHIYFVSIHPFEDGNGRISRALSEKALAQTLERPALFALSYNIESTKKEYYSELEKNQKSLKVDSWLSYFFITGINAAKRSQDIVKFIVEKTRLYERIKGRTNKRQEKVLDWMFAAGLEGFRGGMSASKYMATTGTYRQQATRDLQGLVDIGALTKTGTQKSTRYWLNISEDLNLEKVKVLNEQSKKPQK